MTITQETIKTATTLTPKEVLDRLGLPEDTRFSLLSQDNLATVYDAAGLGPEALEELNNNAEAAKLAMSEALKVDPSDLELISYFMQGKVISGISHSIIYTGEENLNFDGYDDMLRKVYRNGASVSFTEMAPAFRLMVRTISWHYYRTQNLGHLLIGQLLTDKNHC